MSHVDYNATLSSVRRRGVSELAAPVVHTPAPVVPNPTAVDNNPTRVDYNAAHVDISQPLWTRL